LNRAIEHCRTDIVEMLLSFGGMPIDTKTHLYRAVNTLWMGGSKLVYLVNVLLAVGFEHTDRYYDKYIDTARTFSEQEVWAARYRVFFGRSLCNQLLYCLAK
jgi:hypothetical protein